jgi:hypothetical protein
VPFAEKTKLSLCLWQKSVVCICVGLYCTPYFCSLTGLSFFMSVKYSLDYCSYKS